jgi:hypothetical protein
MPKVGVSTWSICARVERPQPRQCPRSQAQSGLVAWRLSASFSRSLSRDRRPFGFGRLDTVNGAANEDSPPV